MNDSIRYLQRAIALSQKDFSLYLAYGSSENVSQGLEQVESNVIQFDPSSEHFFQSIVPGQMVGSRAVSIVGMEETIDFGSVLWSLNLIREKMILFSCPVIIWGSPQLVASFIRGGSDTYSWASSFDLDAEPATIAPETQETIRQSVYRNPLITLSIG